MKNPIAKTNSNLDLLLKLIHLWSQIRFPFQKQKRKEFRHHKESQILLKKSEYKSDEDFDQNLIPIFIISYNRLTYVKNTIEYLEKLNLSNIHIIDNNSDYKPLLDYLSELKYPVHFLKQNFGQNVLWKCDEFKSYTENGMYIVTDPDLEFNEELPQDFIKTLYRILSTYPNITKVGFALKLSDLPNDKFSDQIKQWEGKYWQDKVNFEDKELYLAEIDTTFALYRPGKLMKRSFFKAIRVAGSFTARHLPWYQMFIDNAENNYYKQTADKEVASWTKDSERFK